MTAPAAPTSPPAPPKRLSRDDIVRLGQSGRPWEFLPLALQALALAPGDHGMRLLAAAAFAQVGLRTAALELLGSLPPHLAEEPAIAGLRAATEPMPDDRIDGATSGAVARANAEALAAHGIDLLDHLPAWAERRAGEEWFAATGGNIVRRVRGSWRAADWRALADLRGGASRFAAQHLPDPADAAGPAGENNYTIEGVDPPWILLELHRRTPRGPDGFGRRLFVLQADPLELLDGLAQADLREVLARPGLTVLAGPDGSERLGAILRGRLDTQVTGAFVPLSGVRTRLEPPPGRILDEAEALQLREHERLAARVREIYAGRDRAWWAARYEEACRPGTGRPLRVLIPSCRYTTYVRHAADDLAEAFGAAGCEARVLLEPDAHSRFSSVAYLRALDEFEPDLVVLVNYTRAKLGAWFPRTVPFVCWIQDAMPHQFDAAAGAAQGEMDFLVGHVHAELHGRFGYPAGRSLEFPVVASARKFHAEPADPELRRRFGCELALVSHHSETPDAMHARLVREAGSTPQITRLLEALRPRVQEAAGLAMARGPLELLRQAALLTVREVLGAEPDAKLLATLYRHYALPMADRTLRHEAIGWAAEIAQRRGWRLRLYGQGWETHPSFAPYAQGPLEHGEELRACYQSAAVHLHVSINTLMHQRVFECALSGGLPLCRLTRDALAPATFRVRRAIAEGVAAACTLDGSATGYVVADHHESMRFASLCQRLGINHGPFAWTGGEALPEVPPERDPALVLGDLPETTFSSPEGLERLVERAIENPAWRGAMSGWIARNVRGRLTHAALADQITALVRGSLI